MAKIMNVVFGIGIAVILYIVVLLGINVFYPEPNFDNYNCTGPQPVEIQICDPNMTVANCYTVVSEKQQYQSTTKQQEAFDKCQKAFETANEEYSRNFLFITNIVGAIIVTVGLILFIYLPTMINLSVGTSFAGLALIFFGFIMGWQSTNDKLKFILGAVIAVIVIAYAIIVNKRYIGEKKKSKD